MQRPVYMDRREAGGVGELGLRDRQLVSLPVHQAKAVIAGLSSSETGVAGTSYASLLFFHVIDGVETIDSEGTVLANVDEARAKAIVLSGAY